MNDQDAVFVERLKLERKRRGWTQSDLAERLDVSHVTVNRWERGRQLPHPTMRNEILKKLGLTAEAVMTNTPGVWMVPFHRNRYFLGREQILQRLAHALNQPGGKAIIADGPRKSYASSRALSGLGGIGKTQTAIAYAYSHAKEYEMVLWVRGDSYLTMVGDFAALAPRLGLPDYGETIQLRLATAVKQHLQEKETRSWLLIVDNVNDIGRLLPLLPTISAAPLGAVLVTTRQSHAASKVMTRVEVAPFTDVESVEFLLWRVRDALGVTRDELPAEEQTAAVALATLMRGLPLALEQAASYIEEFECSLADYVTLYIHEREVYLALRNPVDAYEYDESVATTWRLSFEQVEKNRTAHDLLYFCAFLAPDAIPEDIFLSGHEALGENLSYTQDQRGHLYEAVDLLLNYSLIQYQTRARMLSIHPLVQVVIQDAMTADERRDWAERAMLAVNAVYPPVADQSDWELCDRLLPHALLAIQIAEKFQVASVDLARLMHEVAMYLQDRARYDEAEALFLRALELRQLLAPDSVDVGTTHNALGDLRREQGRLAEAEPDLLLSVEITENRLGTDDVLVARSLANLASLYFARGEHARALPLYERAKRIYEQHMERERLAGRPLHRSQKISYARLLGNLGATLMECARLDEAEALIRESLALLEREVGPAHLDLATHTNNLGILLNQRGVYEESESQFDRARRLWEAHLESDHPQLAILYNNLAELFKNQGRYAEAIPYYKLALDIWVLKNHPNIAIVHHNLADIAFAEGRYSDAEKGYLRALPGLEAIGGSESHLAAYAINGLANVYREQRRYAEAEREYRRALHIRQAVWKEPNHPETAETMDGLGQLYAAMGEYEQAREWYQRALTARETSLGEQHPLTLETRERLSALPHTLGDDEGGADQAAL